MGGAATLAASSLQPNAQNTTSGQSENTAHFASRSSVNLPRIPGRSPKFKQNAEENCDNRFAGKPFTRA